MLKHTLVALALALSACGGAAQSTPASSASTPAAAMKAPGEAKVGDRTHCPVSGEEFTVTESSPKAEYNGKTYYFCCGGCDTKFKADPQKFLSGGST
jgi:YHS domain-containing protein